MPGLIKPIEIKDDFKAAFIPMAWDAITHKKQTWGYPISLEAVSLIYNKKTSLAPRRLNSPNSCIQQGTQGKESERDLHYVACITPTLVGLSWPAPELTLQENGRGL